MKIFILKYLSNGNAASAKRLLHLVDNNLFAHKVDTRSLLVVTNNEKELKFLREFTIDTRCTMYQLKAMPVEAKMLHKLFKNKRLGGHMYNMPNVPLYARILLLPIKIIERPLVWFWEHVDKKRIVKNRK